jgi:hypothetical protein
MKEPVIRMKLKMRKPVVRAGFSAPARHPLGRERRTVMLAELVAGLALALSTMIAATVLTVGIARAGVIDGVVGHEGSLFSVALLIGVIVIGIGGLAVLPDRKAE